MKDMQSTSSIFLVRPSSFGFNQETADSNSFQNKVENCRISDNAIKEFDNFADILVKNGIDVNIFKDTKTPIKPDSIFPNNWVSFHKDGTVILYPMYAKNRRAEKRKDIIDGISKKFAIKQIIDLSHYENEWKFLEGTGSVVFDRVNKIAYACLSPRTNKEILAIICEILGYRAITFNSCDSKGIAIYHTNVMMSIGSNYSIICLNSIKDEKERNNLKTSLEKTGHEIVEISLNQMCNFAGNMQELKNSDGIPILVMSKSAYQIIDNSQKSILSAYCKLLPIPIKTIETTGGGSARCMIAENFLAHL